MDESSCVVRWCVERINNKRFVKAIQSFIKCLWRAQLLEETTVVVEHVNISRLEEERCFIVSL